MLITVDEKQALDQPAKVAKMMQAVLEVEGEIDRDKEHFWVIGLTTRNSVKYVELVALGILDGCLVHPREVYRFAVMQGVKGIILCHNHPSGHLEASPSDLATTEQLYNAGSILGIEVIDHVIITNSGHVSLRELNCIGGTK